MAMTSSTSLAAPAPFFREREAGEAALAEFGEDAVGVGLRAVEVARDGFDPLGRELADRLAERLL